MQKMELDYKSVAAIIEKLISCEISREEADEWAYKQSNLLEEGKLKLTPRSDEDFLWSAICYLHGIDMKVGPEEYMHSIEDIRMEFEEKWKR